MTRTPASFLKTLAGRTDPHAFAIIGAAGEVLGQGFRPLAT